jgi:hypothetical protein
MTREEAIEHAKACVGKGWHALLEKLVDDLLALGWDGSLHQVKEKYGGLRFYIGFGSDEIFDCIEEAEEASYRVCEECGDPGTLRDVLSWRLTLCDACFDKEVAKGRKPTELEDDPDYVNRL